jgi:hypothetical protein
MEMSAVAEFTSASKEIKSVSADITFSPVSVNQEIRSLVLDTINGASGVGGIKGRLRAAARALGLTFDRVRRYHYGEVKRIEAHEAFQIIQRAQQAKRDQFARMQLEYEALRLEISNSCPSWLAFLVPPAVAPLPDLEGVEVAETEPNG